MAQLINQRPKVEIVHPVKVPWIVDQKENKNNSFIEANTLQVYYEELRQHHIIPVYAKTNERLISQAEFIESTSSIVKEYFHGEHILKPQIRVSHPIKGRVPSAKDKVASQLLEKEKTLYYERMMFAIEIPSISAKIGGNTLSLTIGGVKAYNLDNLYSRSQADQHFKLFVGFQNKVCTNLCVWTDGLMMDTRVKQLSHLQTAVFSLLENYNHQTHLKEMKELPEYVLNEKQFAQLIGRCKMYQHLSLNMKEFIPPFQFGDQQINMVVKDYYSDKSFCKDENGNINLWRLYNLFTGANKSSYIDSFLERGHNAYELAEVLKTSLKNNSNCWYLN